jgi:hypothetical protein
MWRPSSGSSATTSADGSTNVCFSDHVLIFPTNRSAHMPTVYRSVGIATRYCLDGPGIESRWRRDFTHPSRPTLLSLLYNRIPVGNEIFPTCPDRPWGPPSLLYSGYPVFPGVKRPGRGVNHPPHLAPRLKKEYSYTSTPPLGLRGLL